MVEATLKAALHARDRRPGRHVRAQAISRRRRAGARPSRLQPGEARDDLVRGSVKHQQDDDRGSQQPWRHNCAGKDQHLYLPSSHPASPGSRRRVDKQRSSSRVNKQDFLRLECVARALDHAAFAVRWRHRLLAQLVAAVPRIRERGGRGVPAPSARGGQAELRTGALLRVLRRGRQVHCARPPRPRRRPRERPGATRAARPRRPRSTASSGRCSRPSRSRARRST